MFAVLILLAILIPMASGVTVKFLKTDRRTAARVALTCLLGGTACAIACLFCPANAGFTLMRLSENIAIRFTLDRFNRFYLVLVS